MGHLDRKLHMLHLQNVQPTFQEIPKIFAKKKSGMVCYKSLPENLLMNQESCFD